MSEVGLHEYNFDEEAHGFGEPATARRPALRSGQKVAAAAIAAGLIVFAVQLTGRLAVGSWLGLASSLGLLSVGLLGFFYSGYAGTPAGIRNDGIQFSSAKMRGAIGWGLGFLLTGFYALLYWYGDVLAPAIRIVDPLARVLSGAEAADRWFFYGTLYTLAILVFGVRMLLRYRHNRYERLRTFSVMFFQLGAAFLLPNLLKAFQQQEHYFTYFWPLKPEYLYPWNVDQLLHSSGGLGIFMFVWGAVLTFVGTPILTYFFGKRWYCSWVCGCGGLAETLGDPFRQLSSKSTISWKLERAIIYSVLGLVILTTASLWVNSLSEGRLLGQVSGRFSQWYGFYIGALFAGVLGVGFYPILGSRIWCRFGCPMAAILGILQRFFSRFRITTNGAQCISCGNCSSYCEMGIDVRAYAQRGENIVRASCVGCGVCSAVCPRGVLKLENGGGFGDRYPNSDRPLDAFLEAIRDARVYGDSAPPDQGAT